MDATIEVMGCADPARKNRLASFVSLVDAWNESTSPGDLVWLATRVASTPRDRVSIVRAFTTLLEKLRLEPAPKATLEQALTELADADEDLPAVGRSLKPHVAALKSEYAKADRQARGRPSPATFALRAAATALEVVALICIGGWPSKAAEAAGAAIEETSKALGADASGLTQQLREHVPFADFQTGWFSFGARARD
jgi:hypothetical protein